MSNEQESRNENSLEHAVSRLLEEPEVETPEASLEPVEETAELEEESSVESEVESDEVEEVESDIEYDESDLEEDAKNQREETSEFYTIKVDGDELEVNLEELLNGYQRQKDYTKKTQTLAEQRKEYEAKQVQIAELQQTYMTQAQMANEVLNRELKAFENVDWDALKISDPIDYVQKQLEVQDVRNRQNQLVQEAQVMHQQQQQQQQAELQKVVEAEKEILLEKFPEWKDQDNAKANQQQIVDYARSQGFEDSELASVYRARDLLILDKARKYDEMLEAKEGIAKKRAPAKVRQVVKSKAPAPKSSSKTRKVKDAQSRLRKSGSLRDAAQLMNELASGKAIKK